MGRPRQFVEEVAIGRAMEAFWETGYEATSTEQLCEATGLGRSSIYNTFASKHELFRRALRRYDEITAEARSTILAGEGPVRGRLRRLLQVVIDEELDHDRRGCLATNTAIELGRSDPEIVAEVRRSFDGFAESVREVIERGQAEGEIDAARDARALALFVHGTVGGIRIMARLGHDRDSLESIADTALGAI
jgi:TetR/AcrR family transcriptional regulator, transcriptional repressor for nem operon